MNGRAISFILLSSLIMMVAMTLQSIYKPAPQADPTSQLTQASPADAEETPQGDGSNEEGQDSDEETKLDSPDSNIEIPGAETESAPTGTTPELADATNRLIPESDETTGSAAVEEIPATLIDSFITIGSLDENGSDRYLITVNENGGTIHRVELNFRNKSNGRFKYRDLEYKGGYLGCLDCVDTETGCEVRTVGRGTPASLATCPGTSSGIQVGDILLSLNGEPITSAREFERLLAQKTKPRTNIELVVAREQSELAFEVALTDKPIELLRPEGDEIDPDFDYPESFVLTLLKPMPAVDQTWPDLDRGMRNEVWTLVPDAASERNEVVLKYELTVEKLAALGLDGPITVFKRFQIPALPPEDIYDLDSRTFHFDFEIEIKNGADQPQTIAYELDGPTGAPTETWWYANKIHGRTTAIGYVAGARDVVGSNGKQPFVFFGGPEIVKGSIKTPPSIYYICDPTIDNPEARFLNYVGVDTQYFNVSLIPVSIGDERFSCNSITADTNGGKIPEKNVRQQKLVDCTFRMAKTVTIPPGESYRQSFEIFGGPKDAEVLQQYALDDLRSFGWFAWCSKPLMWLLHVFYKMTFSFSYGLAIIMLTILVRSLMIPISRKAALNAQMMQHLQPQMKAIADKYKDDMEKRAAAQRELFKRHSYNPFGGCFMMFFQLPIFIGLYRGLSVDMALRDQPLIPGLSWCSNLSGPDQLLYWKDWMPAMLAGETGWLGPYLNILPLITMVLFIAQQKLFMPPAADDQQKMMQKMMTFMMIFMGVMFFKVSSGLCLYFITSSVWGIAERKLLPKPVLATDDLPAFDALEADKPAKKKPVSKADEKAALKREEELLERKRRNAERKKKLKERGV